LALALTLAQGAHSVGAMLTAGLVLKLTLDSALSHRLIGRGSSAAEIVSMLCKDLFVLGMWIAGGLLRRVVWRGNVLLIGPGSLLSPVPSWRRAPQPISALREAA
jgi:hypothetical protein